MKRKVPVQPENQPSTDPKHPLKLPVFWLLGFVFVALIALVSWNKPPEPAVPTPQETTAQHTPWFAAYADVTQPPFFAFEKQVPPHTSTILSFIVSHPGSPCTPSWGGYHTLGQARAALTLDQRINQLKKRGGKAIVSFGGADGSELATACTDQPRLTSAYRTVVERYQLDIIDLDLEGTGLLDEAARTRRAAAIASLQEERNKAGKPLAVWLTLPVTPQGLGEPEERTIATFLNAGVDLAGVNVMTMDFGEDFAPGASMADAAKSALMRTHEQLDSLYQQAGFHLADARLWAKLGATPMIGQNDVRSEVFSLADAKELNRFARTRGLGRISMWSANRDGACPPGAAPQTAVPSNTCSSVVQPDGEFARLLGNGLETPYSPAP